MLCDGGETEIYQEAMLHNKKYEWLKAIQEEMKSSYKNHTYDVILGPFLAS